MQKEESKSGVIFFKEKMCVFEGKENSQEAKEIRMKVLAELIVVSDIKTDIQTDGQKSKVP